MKQFELIEWYPSLPKEWKLFTGRIVVTKRGDWYVCDMHKFSVSEIEDNPEFWQEVRRLNVPVGTTFHVWPSYNKPSEVYIIGDRKSNNTVRVELIDSVYGSVKNHWNYTIDQVNDYFKDEVWIPISKEAIVQTNDEVDLYVGDTAYIVKFDGFVDRLEIFREGVTLESDFIGYNIFSTFEAAEEYIDMNEKKFSKQVILDALENCDTNDQIKRYLQLK